MGVRDGRCLLNGIPYGDLEGVRDGRCLLNGIPYWDLEGVWNGRCLLNGIPYGDLEGVRDGRCLLNGIPYGDLEGVWNGRCLLNGIPYGDWNGGEIIVFPWVDTHGYYILFSASLSKAPQELSSPLRGLGEEEWNGRALSIERYPLWGLGWGRDYRIPWVDTHGYYI